MAIKDQLNKIKENWLIVVIIIALFLFMNMSGSPSVSYATRSYASEGMAQAEYAAYDMAGSSYIPPVYESDFAPDVEERKIIKTASLSTEVERGTFHSNEKRFKDMITASDSFILNENVNKYGTKRKEYYQGTYSLRVDTTKYDALISQLKDIGEIQSFNENTVDVTGRYTNTEINLELERSRLERYKEMYAEAEDMEDKIELNDRIFNQERVIKYLEDSLKRTDERIEYTSIYFTLKEKRSEYADVVWVKVSALAKSFVDSVNALLTFIFTIIPWAIIAVLAFFGWKFFKKKFYK